MRTLLASFVAGMALLGAGVANAGTFVSSGPVSIEAYTSVSQILPPNPCDFTLNGVVVGGASLSTSTGATPSSPVLLCLISGFSITMNEEMTIDDVGAAPGYLYVNNITANSIVGTCGPGTVRGRIVNYGPDLILVLDPTTQTIPGVPVPCSISGRIIVRNVQYVP